MKIKELLFKLCLLACSFVCLLSVMTPQTFAANNISVPTVVNDTAKVAEKSFQPKPISSQVTTLAASSSPMWYANSFIAWNDVATSSSDSYTDSTKTTKNKINRIYAQTRCYVNGGFQGNSTDDQANSSHAGAGYQASASVWDDVESYGHHIFELNGYQTWTPDTYGT